MKKFAAFSFAMILLLTPLAALAADAIAGAAGATGTPVAAAAAESGGTNWVHIVLAFLTGVVGMKLASFVADWLDKKGPEFVQAELEKLRAKMNSNPILSQIAADDALISIVEHAIPEVFHTLADNVKSDLSDGKFDAVNWKDIGLRLWAAVEGQIKGGATDYLKASSFADGAAVAQMVAQRFFKKKAMDKAVPPAAETK